MKFTENTCLTYLCQAALDRPLLEIRQGIVLAMWCRSLLVLLCPVVGATVLVQKYKECVFPLQGKGDSEALVDVLQFR